LTLISWLNLTTRTGWKFSVVCLTSNDKGVTQLSTSGVQALHYPLSA
jgi:hypothetical protein